MHMNSIRIAGSVALLATGVVVARTGHATCSTPVCSAPVNGNWQSASFSNGARATFLNSGSTSEGYVTSFTYSNGSQYLEAYTANPAYTNPGATCIDAYYWNGSWSSPLEVNGAAKSSDVLVTGGNPSEVGGYFWGCNYDIPK
jgi:hypothetical protein